MDHDKDSELDQLMERASKSALKSLDATVDVKYRLWNLFREAGIAPDLGTPPDRGDRHSP